MAYELIYFTYKIDYSTCETPYLLDQIGPYIRYCIALPIPLEWPCLWGALVVRSINRRSPSHRVLEAALGALFFASGNRANFHMHQLGQHKAPLVPGEHHG